ncbi:MAG: MFS transporter [Candidatus Pacebacteria bacterium]|nr:MFS transporter [Candidatus Paceibacterota bacterium]
MRNKISQFISRHPLVAKYFLLQFFLGMHFIGAVTLPFFTDWGGLSFAQVMILQSWFSFWVFTLEVPTGVVADYLSRKASISLGALVCAVAALTYGLYPNFYLFLLAEFLWAIGFALQSGASEAWFYDSLAEKKQQSQAKKFIGQAHSFFLGGMMMAATLGGVIAQQFGLNVPILFQAGTFFLAFLFSLTFKEPQIDTQPSESKRLLEIARQGIKQVRHNRLVRLIMLDTVIVALAAYYVLWFEQAVLQKVGVALQWFGLVHALMLLAEIAVSSQFEWFDRQLERFSISYRQLSAALTGLGFFLALIPSPWTAVLFILLSGGFGLTRIKYLSAQLNHVIDSKQRATVLSFLSMLRRMVIMIVNPVFGWLVELNFNLALILVGLLPFFVFLLPSSPALPLSSNKTKIDNN